MSELYKSQEWLRQKYLAEKLDANAIGRIVGRDGKTVWTWLRKFQIPTRPRGYGHENNPRFSFWIHGTPNPMQGKKLSPETRQKLSEIAKADGRVPFDPAVGSYMKGRSGAATPGWRGGITPERQAFYSSAEWKSVIRLVWARDNATCQKCGKRNVRGERFSFDIHHITPFECRELRASLKNLVLLCEPCHYWVHSSENTGKQFIREVANAAA